ncbi:MAG TPA: hypothetical protein PLO29_07175 [Paludibacter sp.]|nr:hypothetical protein [Paludibacteraceae bacterium]HQB28716.1 hypothetical protein [Paludibacter sp.]
MERTVRIGADEIILWLRKNRLAAETPNDGITGLGVKILDLIVNKLHGRKVEDSAPSFWDATDTVVQQFGLPKTSAQYEINVNRLTDLYLEISNW